MVFPRGAKATQGMFVSMSMPSGFVDFGDGLGWLVLDVLGVAVVFHPALLDLIDESPRTVGHTS